VPLCEMFSSANFPNPFGIGTFARKQLFPVARARECRDTVDGRPNQFQISLAKRGRKEAFARGESHRAEAIRFDEPSGQFVPYFSGISAEGLAFSKDGQYVAYTSYPDGILGRSKLDGSERRQLTFTLYRVLLPRWSPADCIQHYAAGHGRNLEDLRDIKGRRGPSGDGYQQAESNGCELVAGRQFAGIWNASASGRANLFNGPKIRESFSLTRFGRTVFSPLGTRWKAHRGVDDSTPVSTDDF
jgi:hypothetical protein